MRRERRMRRVKLVRRVIWARDQMDEGDERRQKNTEKDNCTL
jgi:hypothetical protein